MKRILLYENRKCDPIAFDISTPELEQIAYLNMFRILNEEWEVYSDICNSLEYTKARTGDVKAIKRLLSSRKGREYEGWRMVEVV